MEKDPPHKNGVPYEGNDRYEGYCVDLANKVAEAIGFSYTIKVVSDGKYGNENENRTWDGMVGELIREVSDKWSDKRVKEMKVINYEQEKEM